MMVALLTGDSVFAAFYVYCCIYCHSFSWQFVMQEYPVTETDMCNFYSAHEP